MVDIPQPGASGEPPVDPLDPHDQGGLFAHMTVDVKNKLIVMNFGKPVTFLKMRPDEAKHWAIVLYQQAEALEKC